MHYSSLQRSTLVVATLSNFLMPFIASSVIVALPVIAHDLNIGARALSWISTAYLLTTSALLIPFGRLSDIYGRKRVFQWGILIQCVSSAAAVFSGSGSMLIACRVVQGVGGAMIFGTGVTIVTSVFPPATRGSALGVVIAAVFVGLSAGPFIGGFLTTHLGWESVFLCSVLVGIVILTISLWKLKGEWAEARGETFDLAGSGIYVAALAVAMYGLSLIPAASGFVLVLAGIAGIAEGAKGVGRVLPKDFHTATLTSAVTFAASRRSIRSSGLSSGRSRSADSRRSCASSGCIAMRAPVASPRRRAPLAWSKWWWVRTMYASLTSPNPSKYSIRSRNESSLGKPLSIMIPCFWFTTR